MVRAVVDSNILVSSLLSPLGPSRRIWNAFLNGKFTLVLSSLQMTELTRALLRPKIFRRVERSRIEELLSFLELYAEFCEPVRIPSLCRDRHDDHLLAVASQAKVQFLITGDADIKSVKTFSIPIVTPVQFLYKLNEP